ncbi:MAG: VanZ family protein [Oscillospiraceae bacterium]
MFLPRPLEGMIIGFILFLMWYPFSFKKNGMFRNLCLASMFVYVGAVISLTMIYAPPSNWNITANNTTFALSSVNLTPFKSSIQIFKNCKAMGNYHDFIWLIGGNTIMLMPLGILIPLINPKYGLGRISLIAMAVSLGIEFLQLSSNILLGTVLRAVEIDDFIQNTLGCIVAYLIFALFRELYRRIVSKK